MTARLAKAVLPLLAAIAFFAPSAQADLGLRQLNVDFVNPDGSAATQAGSHPYAMDTFFEFNSSALPSGGQEVDGGDFKDLIFAQARGFIGSATAVPRCSTIDFVTLGEANVPSCPDNTAVGITAVAIGEPDPDPDALHHFEALGAAVYNLTPPPGVPARLGFSISGVPVVIDVALKQSPDYNILAGPVNAPQPLTVFGSVFELWGAPADPRHDFARGHCALSAFPKVTESIVEGRLNLKEGGPLCPATGAPMSAFLTLPRSCDSLVTAYRLDSWTTPGAWVEGSIPTGPFTGCGNLEFGPGISSLATTDSATTGTGLDFELDFEDSVDHAEGLVSPEGIAESDIKKAVITLPAGMSANPSLAAGLGACTPADLDRETIDSPPGAGCPNSSKIGTVSVQTPIVDEEIHGDVFLAQPDDPATATPKVENPFDSLLAFYIVLRNRNLGALVKVPAEVTPDPTTGQLVTTVDNTPQVPFTRFRFHFREGLRAPLITPAACGTYTTKAELTPWARPGETITETADFQITRGPGGAPCPSGGIPPLRPGLLAGTINNRAGSYSPFNLRLFRSDSEQEITHFSIKLPPGLIGKLAGIPYCSDAAVAQAESREHTGGGGEELASPACPLASEIGRTLVGAGVGSALTYVPGKVYLAGPYHGSALSIVAITSGVVGPFDVGTVVVRQALKINPETAEVFIDATGSDPIPHIIQGIPVHLRDIRAYVDRPDFVLNPTNCTRTSTASTVLGSGLNFVSEADDNPITVTSPFQAADCASLGFAPKLALSLKGGTKRGAHPAFKALLTYPKGSYANIAAAQVTLPHSAFLEQSHIKTICTRVQFKEGAGNGAQCPAGSIYGSAKAITPLLSDPLQGPVFLRSSSHNLPDLVVALHNSQVDFNLVGRVDSVKGGRIRNTFEAAPDAPVSSFTLEMQGGKKGLLVNSTNLCKSTNKAIAHFTGQNGKVHDFNPVVKPDCKKAKKHKGAKKKGKRHS